MSFVFLELFSYTLEYESDRFAKTGSGQPYTETLNRKRGARVFRSEEAQRKIAELEEWEQEQVRSAFTFCPIYLYNADHFTKTGSGQT